MRARRSEGRGKRKEGVIIALYVYAYTIYVYIYTDIRKQISIGSSHVESVFGVTEDSHQLALLVPTFAGRRDREKYDVLSIQGR